jgi:hypothetical protein
MSAIHGTTSQGTRTPLKRTDGTTWVDGLPIEQYSNPKSKMPRFQPHTPMPKHSTGSADDLDEPASLSGSTRVVGTTKILANRQTKDTASTSTAPTNPQTLPTPARAQAAPTPAVTPQHPRQATDSPHGASHASRRPDISKNPGSARNNVASDNSSPHPRPRTAQQPRQSSKPLHAGPKNREMPATATASITGHGDRHVINQSQVVATARSGQNMPHKRPGMFQYTLHDCH